MLMSLSHKLAARLAPAQLAACCSGICREFHTSQASQGVGIPERRGPSAEEGPDPTVLSEAELATSQREAPKDLAGILDESAQTLFLTELWRGLGLTMKVFFEPKVTIN
ncbi:hypothetical protein N2152v2_006964, partial [Parachlorella kessleri]